MKSILAACLALACLSAAISAAFAQDQAGKPGASRIYRWVDTNAFADWGGLDIASTSGDQPLRRLNGLRLCDRSHAGFVADCWSNRPSGYPPGVPTNIVGNPGAWCTYKDNSIRVTKPSNGGAPYGRIYVCAAVLDY